MRCDKKTTLEFRILRDYTRSTLFKKSQFDFSLYFQNAQPDHIKITDVKFLQWFIGFSEGDGSFIISKTYIINQKEIALLYNIRTRLDLVK
jgi:hypothetical protein